MDNHLFLSLLIPLLGATLVTLVRRGRRTTHWVLALTLTLHLAYSLWLIGRTLLPSSPFQRQVALQVGSLQVSLWRLFPNGRQVTQVSDWGAPYGISLVADSLSALMLFLTSLIACISVLVAFRSLGVEQERGFLYPLVLLFLAGMGGVFTAGDLFTLSLWFELVLLASFGMLVWGGARGQVAVGLKYMLLNLVGSATLIIGCGLSYGMAGTLNMAHLSQRFATCEQLRVMNNICEEEIDVIFEAQPSVIPASGLVNNCAEIARMSHVCTENDEETVFQHPGPVTLLATIFLVACSIRSALAPTAFWLPGSLQMPPTAVTVLLGGVLTHAGLYALYRLFGLVYHNELALLAPLLLLIAALSMVVGVVGALAQNDLRRILAFDLITQMGFVLMGLGMAGAGFAARVETFALAAGILFLVHAVVVKAALFAIAGVIEQLSGTGDIRRMGGLAKRAPALALVWVVACMALIGLPPLSGFFGKLALLQAAFDIRLYDYAALMVVVTVLSMLPLLKIWHEVFWKPLPDAAAEPAPLQYELLIPGAFLVVFSLLLGLGASFVVDYSIDAATQALDVSGYVQDVLVTAAGAR
jgi:multicomponent Na+:H+ antiporter subunit D